MGKKFQGLHLSTQLILFFCVVFGVLSSGLILFFYYTRETFQAASKRYSEDVISQFTETVYANYDSLHNILYFLSFQTDVQNFLLCEDSLEKYDLYTRMRHNLVSGTDLNPHIMDIAILDSHGEAYFLLNPYYKLPDLDDSVQSASLSPLMRSEKGMSYFTFGTPIFHLSDHYMEEAIGRIYLILDTNAFAFEDDKQYMDIRTKLYLSDCNDRIFWSNVPTKEITIKELEPSRDRKIFLPEVRLYLTSSLQREDTIYSLYEVQSKVFFVLLILLLVLMYLVVLYIRNLQFPLQELYHFIRNIKKGGLRGLRSNITLTGCMEVEEIGEEINSMLEQTDSLTRQLFKTTTQLYEAQLLKNEAELEFMRSQINPHFLYNTLDSITGLAAEKNAPEIVRLTKALSRIFKYSIKGEAEVTLKTEMQIIKSYVSIQLLRFPNRFQVEYRLGDEFMDLKVPKMILQPLVENAIIHGIENYPQKSEGEKALLYLDAYEEDNGIHICVFNDGLPIPEDRLETIQRGLEEAADALKAPAGGSIGIFNVHSRLRLIYGPEYGLELESGEGGTRAVIVIPKHTGGEACTRPY